MDLRVVIYPHHGWWIAQCLEHDVAAQARDPRSVVHKIDEALIVNTVIRKENGLPGLEFMQPAPKRFEEAWCQGLLIPWRDDPWPTLSGHLLRLSIANDPGVRT